MKFELVPRTEKKTLLLPIKDVKVGDVVAIGSRRYTVKDNTCNTLVFDGKNKGETLALAVNSEPIEVEREVEVKEEASALALNSYFKTTAGHYCLKIDTAYYRGSVRCFDLKLRTFMHVQGVVMPLDLKEIAD